MPTCWGCWTFQPLKLCLSFPCYSYPHIVCIVFRNSIQHRCPLNYSWNPWFWKLTARLILWDPIFQGQNVWKLVSYPCRAVVTIINSFKLTPRWNMTGCGKVFSNCQGSSKNAWYGFVWKIKLSKGRKTITFSQVLVYSFMPAALCLDYLCYIA